MTQHYIAELALTGLLMGGVYTISAFGLSVIYGVARVLNLAHGSFILLGALAAYVLFVSTGSNPFLLSFLLAPVFFGFGFAFERGLLRMSAAETREAFHSVVLVTLGAALLIEGLSLLTVPREFSVSYYLPSIQVGGVSVSGVRMTIIGIVSSLTLLLEVFLRKAYMGKVLRAVADDQEAARLVGINVSFISSVTFGLGASLAAVSGVFLVLITGASPNAGLPLTLKAVTIVVLGGLGSLWGTLTGGILLGMAESFSGFYLGPVWSGTVAVIILMGALILRPRGLFGYR